MASLRDSLLHVLNNYSATKRGAFRGSAVAQYIRKEFAGAVKGLLAGAPSEEVFSVEGSPGRGVWADSPWCGVFHRLVTDTAQEGYYVVYLFKYDLSGVYLTLNQGVTTVRKIYKSDTTERLQLRAEDYCARLGSAVDDLHSGEIDLAARKTGGLAADYEAGSIVDKYYALSDIPSEESLRSDLHRFLNLYIRLEMSLNIRSDVEEEPGDYHFEDTSKVRLHKRIERNAKLIRDVKKKHGYMCRACGFDFSKKYREVGSQFIEAHHLTPLAELAEGRIKLNPATDFAVLCSNCHRMIHRTDCISDVDGFRKRYLIDST